PTHSADARKKTGAAPIRSKDASGASTITRPSSTTSSTHFRASPERMYDGSTLILADRLARADASCHLRVAQQHLSAPRKYLSASRSIWSAARSHSTAPSKHFSTTPKHFYAAPIPFAAATSTLSIAGDRSPAAHR